MIFAMIGAAWLVLALAVGSLLGRCITVANEDLRAEVSDEFSGPLFVSDILKQSPAPLRVDGPSPHPAG